MPRIRVRRQKLTKEQALRLEDKLNLDRPDSPWYNDWYQRRGKVKEARAQMGSDYLTIKHL